MIRRCPLCRKVYPCFIGYRHTCSPEDISAAINDRIAEAMQQLRDEMRQRICQEIDRATVEHKKAGRS